MCLYIVYVHIVGYGVRCHGDALAPGKTRDYSGAGAPTDAGKMLKFSASSGRRAYYSPSPILV